MWNSVRASGLLLASAILVSCSRDKSPKEASSSTTGDSTASVSVAGSSAPPCVVDDAPTTRACENVLPSNWSSLSDADQLARLNAVSWQRANYKGVKRRHNATTCSSGAPRQIVRAPSVSDRMGEPTTWRAGVTVAMAKFAVEGSSTCRDQVYGVSKSERSHFLVFTVASSLVVDNKGDTILGNWMVVSYTPTGERRIESTGVYTRCAVPHPEKHVAAVAEFQTCEQKKQLFALAKKFGLTADAVLDSLARLRDESDNPSSLSTTGAPLTQELLTFLQAARDDAPVWTTCALGCCVAENPVLRTSTLKSMPHIDYTRSGRTESAPHGAWGGS